MSLFNSGLQYVKSVINLRNKQEELRKAKETSKIYYQKEEQFIHWISNQVDLNEKTEYLEAFYDLSLYARKQNLVQVSIFEEFDTDRLTDLRVRLDRDKNAAQYFRKNLTTIYSLLHLLNQYLETSDRPVLSKSAVAEENTVSFDEDEVESAESLEDEYRILDFENIGDLHHTKPVSLTFKGNLYQCGHWGLALAQLCKCISFDQPEVIDQFQNEEERNPKIPWIVDREHKQLLHGRKKIKDHYYINTCLTADNMAYQMKCLLDTAGIQYEEVVLRYRDPKKDKRDIESISNKTEPRMQSAKGDWPFAENNKGLKVFDHQPGNSRQILLNDQDENPKEKLSQEKFINFENIQNLDYTKPVSLKYKDELFYTDFWNSLFAQACTYLIKDYPEVFRSLRDQGVRFGNKQWIVNDEFAHTLSIPKRIASNYYVETGRKTSQLMANLKYLLDECGISYDNIAILFKIGSIPVQEEDQEEIEILLPEDHLSHVEERRQDIDSKTPENRKVEHEEKSPLLDSEDEVSVINFSQINAPEIIGAIPVSLQFKEKNYAFRSWEKLLNEAYLFLYEEFPNAFDDLLDSGISTMNEINKLVKTRSVFGSLMNIKRVLDGNDIPYSTLQIRFKTREQQKKNTEQEIQPNSASAKEDQFYREDQVPKVPETSKTDIDLLKKETSFFQNPYSEDNVDLSHPHETTYEIGLNEINEKYEPVAFSYFENKQEVDSWAEVYELAYEELMDDYDVKIKELADSQDEHVSVRNLYAKRNQPMMRPVKIGDEYYIDTFRSPQQIIQELRYLMDVCNADQENIVFECLEARKEPNPFFKWLDGKIKPGEKTRFLLLYQDIEKQARIDRLIRDNLCESIDPNLYKKIKSYIERNRIFKFNHKGESKDIDNFFNYLLQFSDEASQIINK